MKNQLETIVLKWSAFSYDAESKFRRRSCSLSWWEVTRELTSPCRTMEARLSRQWPVHLFLSRRGIEWHRTDFISESRRLCLRREVVLCTLDYYDSYSACRFSPLDANSRESACLTNFLLSGKCVLLEVANLPDQCTIKSNEYAEESNSCDLLSCSSSNRLFSHLIICQNDQLLIHSLAFGSINPMSKMASSYILTTDEEHLSSNDFDETNDEIDEETLEKDLRVEVNVFGFDLLICLVLEEFHRFDPINDTLSIGNDAKWQNSHWRL